MNVVSAYLIRQVAEVTSDDYKNDVKALYHEAKRRNDKTYASRNFYISKPAQLAFVLTEQAETSGSPVHIVRQYVRSVPGYNSVYLANSHSYEEAYDYCRYPCDVYITAGVTSQTVDGGIYSGMTGRNGGLDFLMYPAWEIKQTSQTGDGEETVTFDWTRYNESQADATADVRTYPTAPTTWPVTNQTLYSGVATDTEIESYYYNSSFVKVNGVWEYIKNDYNTNIPHFATREAAYQFRVNVDKYFRDTMTESDFDSFLSSNLKKP